MKPLFVLAVCLLVAAIISDLIGKRLESDSMLEKAAILQSQLSAQHSRDIHTARWVHIAGYVFFGLGVLAWLLSFIRNERPHFLFLVLIMIFILLQFVFV